MKKSIKFTEKREEGKIRTEKNARDNIKNGNGVRESEMQFNTFNTVIFQSEVSKQR